MRTGRKKSLSLMREVEKLVLAISKGEKNGLLVKRKERESNACDLEKNKTVTLTRGVRESRQTGVPKGGFFESQ